MRCSLARLIELRPYQKQCVADILDAFQRIKRPAVQLPTGSGKTVVFGSLISQVAPLPGQGNKTLVLVNRIEIAHQVKRTIKRMYPTLQVGLEMGDERCYVSGHDVIVAGMPGLAKKLGRFRPEEFKLVIVDEAHHAAAATYRTVFDHFGLLCSDPNLYMAGFSATLTRSDRKQLPFDGDEPVHNRTPFEMIEDGHLSPCQISQYHFDVPLPYDTRKGKLNYLMTEMGCNLVTEVTLEEYKSTLVFAINREHLGYLQNAFKVKGIDARIVTGGMSSRERYTTLEMFKQGEFPVLINCMVLTEGTDLPNVDQIVLATPVGSAVLAMQMIGRGLRRHPGKEHCRVVIFHALQKWNAQDLKPYLNGIGLEFDLIKDTRKRLPDGSNPQQSQGTKVDDYSHKEPTFRSIFEQEPGVHADYEDHRWLRYDGQYFLFTDVCYYRIIKRNYVWHGEALYMPRWGERSNVVAREAPEPERHWMIMNAQGITVYQIDTFASPESAQASIDHIVSARENLPGGERPNYFKRSAEKRVQQATSSQRRKLGLWLSKDKVEKLNRGDAEDLLILRLLEYELTDAKVEAAGRWRGEGQQVEKKH